MRDSAVVDPGLCTLRKSVLVWIPHKERCRIKYTAFGYIANKGKIHPEKRISFARLPKCNQETLKQMTKNRMYWDYFLLLNWRNDETTKKSYDEVKIMKMDDGDFLNQIYFIKYIEESTVMKDVEKLVEITTIEERRIYIREIRRNKRKIYLWNSKKLKKDQNEKATPLAFLWSIKVKENYIREKQHIRKHLNLIYI